MCVGGGCSPIIRYGAPTTTPYLRGRFTRPHAGSAPSSGEEVCRETSVIPGHTDLFATPARPTRSWRVGERAREQGARPDCREHEAQQVKPVPAVPQLLPIRRKGLLCPTQHLPVMGLMNSAHTGNLVSTVSRASEVRSAGVRRLRSRASVARVESSSPGSMMAPVGP